MPTTISGSTGVSQIQDGIVATADIADNAVTNAKVAAVAATKLTGTIADARFPATLPAISGANLTGISSVGGATGVDFNDGVFARWGTGNDLKINHNGTHGYIDNVTGDILIRTNTDKTHIKLVYQGATQLYHTTSAGSFKHFETTSGGATMAGGGKLTLPSGCIFGTDTAAANTLDDYEEGTYTVAVTMGSGTATTDSSDNTLAYTKIGRVVHISGQFKIGAASSADGSFKISLPFTTGSGSESAFYAVGNYRTYNVDTPNDGVSNVIHSETGQALATLEWSRDGSSSTAERATVDGYFMVGLTYFTA